MKQRIMTIKEDIIIMIPDIVAVIEQEGQNPESKIDGMIEVMPEIEEL